ncbi:glycosyltransferase family 4 protein [Stenotrophomonas sp. PS02301]|uniref:glycosyltransferase family 4 protein n=1 Tax=Stenotrophomonas sp. PS02301 TaxID=2991427 RepID=UPI001312D0A5|nr:glycosyltransferase family 4 protein [Stenotrophomonas sp. PS02301]MBU2049746.1 glycosyltransferase family 4 protein [Gammaproteobacteria bacterium]
MKILVVNNMVPGMRGGAEELADQLVLNLRKAGHESELLRVPFTWEPAERIVEEMVMCRNMQINNVDRVIAMKFPAYMIPFPEKVLWLAHQYRQAYDLWDAGQSNIADTPEGRQIRAAIIEADNAAFEPVKDIFVVGRTVQERLLHYNRLQSTVLRAPLNDETMYPGGPYGDYVFAGGRINSGKRQHRLIEAMARLPGTGRLVIAGPADTPGDADRLRALVEKHRLGDRVTLDIGFLPRQKIADYANNALACAYLPFAEDSYGYVTMEACQARKAVLTVNDSGDLTELIHDGVHGWVCDDDTDQLAAALSELFANRARTVELGNAAHAHWTGKNINWTTTVEALAR